VKEVPERVCLWGKKKNPLELKIGREDTRAGAYVRTGEKERKRDSRAKNGGPQELTAF